MRKWIGRWWPYAIFAVGLVAIAAFSTASPSYDDCAAGHYKHYADPEKGETATEVHRTFSENAAIFAECEGEFIHANEGMITAVSTIFIALFTLALWRSTDNLWEAGERQRKAAAKISRRQLRAYLGVTGGGVSEPKNNKVRCAVVLTNKGQTPASKVNRYLSMAIDDAKRLIFEDAAHDPGSWVIAPDAQWTLSKEISISGPERDAIFAGTKTIFVWGKVAYDDIYGKVPRITEFRYKLGLRNSRWVTRPDLIAPFEEFMGWELDPTPIGNEAN